MTIDPVGTFVSEAGGFVRRHPDLSEAQKAMGGTAWGMMRAVLECPDHPGAFRVPLDDQWVSIVCPIDGSTWITPDGAPAHL